MADTLLTLKEWFVLLVRAASRIWPRAVLFALRALDRISGGRYKKLEVEHQELQQSLRALWIEYKKQEQFTMAPLARRIRNREIVTAELSSVISETEGELARTRMLYYGKGISYTAAFLALQDTRSMRPLGGGLQFKPGTDLGTLVHGIGEALMRNLRDVPDLADPLMEDWEGHVLKCSSPNFRDSSSFLTWLNDLTEDQYFVLVPSPYKDFEQDSESQTQSTQTE